MEEKNTISLDEAFETVMNSAFSTGTEIIDFNDSLNRVLAQDIRSDMDMPPFNKATVDGFACRRADLENELEIVETIAAGSYPEKTISKGQCSRIMTGAVVPAGADTIFMVENSELLSSQKVRFTGSFTKDNISVKGEDIKTGDSVLKSGMLIRPQDIAAMACVGCTSVVVSRMPVVAVISTGNELVEPVEIPGLSQIRNINAYELIAQVKRTGGKAKYYGIARDDEKATLKIVSRAISECDIVLISGGVSMGDFDFVPSVLEQAGVKILFSSVRVQPGKPTTFGVHADSLVFGLPGNPVSSFIQFEYLVHPLIYSMMGYKWDPLMIYLPMKMPYSRKSADRQGLVPVKFENDGSVSPVEYHGSAHISALIHADGIISIPAGMKTIKNGEVVGVRQI
jgi:molybdopterin molybdotransferase